MHNTQNKRIAFLASTAELAQSARNTLVHSFGDCDPSTAEVIVALGGDGFMLQTLHATQHLNVPVYGMNRGTVGFLMNEFSTEGLSARLAACRRGCHQSPEDAGNLCRWAHPGGAGYQ
jgi:NAD+ kinase